MNNAHRPFEQRHWYQNISLQCRGWLGAVGTCGIAFEKPIRKVKMLSFREVIDFRMVGNWVMHVKQYNLLSLVEKGKYKDCQ